MVKKKFAGAKMTDAPQYTPEEMAAWEAQQAQQQYTP
jgi:hypothetical protein